MPLTDYPALADVPSGAIFDVRDLPCEQKHGLIFDRWFQLPVNGFFVLINPHVPTPLRRQFEWEFPGIHAWEVLVDSPALGAVKITRLKSDPPGTAEQTDRTCPHHAPD